MDQREREIEPSLHPARVARHLAVSRIGQPDAMEELLRTRPPLILADALERGLQAEVVAAGEQRVERGLLERDADE